MGKYLGHPEFLICIHNSVFSVLGMVRRVGDLKKIPIPTTYARDSLVSCTTIFLMLDYRLVCPIIGERSFFRREMPVFQLFLHTSELR
jgi:hypothetical protein